MAAVLPGSPSPPLPPSLDVSKQVLVTRDAKRFLKRASPLAPLATQFYGLLSAPTAQGKALRAAYAWAVSPSVGAVDFEAADAEIAQALERPPSIALIQGTPPRAVQSHEAGTMKTARLLEDSPSLASDSSSFMSHTSASTASTLCVRSSRTV